MYKQLTNYKVMKLTSANYLIKQSCNVCYMFIILSYMFIK